MSSRTRCWQRRTRPRRPKRLTDQLPRGLLSAYAEEAEPLDASDHALIAAAADVLRARHRPFWHTVAAALRSRDGRIWTGLHLGATVGRLQTCAEAVAMGRAAMEGVTDIETAVAVRHPKPDEPAQEISVVSPCGACREMFADFSPSVRVIVPGPAGLLKLPLGTLLPVPYRR